MKPSGVCHILADSAFFVFFKITWRIMAIKTALVKFYGPRIRHLFILIHIRGQLNTKFMIFDVIQYITGIYKISPKFIRPSILPILFKYQFLA